MNPPDGVIEHNTVITLTLEMEEENVLDSTEIIDLQLQGQQQGNLGYDDAYDGSDANENNWRNGGESNHENNYENIDDAIEGRKYSSLEINYLLLPRNLWNPLDVIIVCNTDNELTLDMENIPHYSENVAFQLEWQRLDDVVHENDGGDADDHDNDGNDVNENNENHEGENDDGNGNESIDLAIENQAPQM